MPSRYTLSVSDTPKALGIFKTCLVSEDDPPYARFVMDVPISKEKKSANPWKDALPKHTGSQQVY